MKAGAFFRAVNWRMFRAGNGRRRVILYEADSEVFNGVRVLPGGEEDCGEGADDSFGGVSPAEGFCVYEELG